MSTQLSVNLNKIALLRNARGRNYPSVTDFAARVLDSGAIGVTMHPRPDERHARKSDIYELAELLIDYAGKELNVEGNPTEEFMQLVLDIKPHQCTLVPDDPDQITSDHGWNLNQDLALVKSTVNRLKDAGIRSSIFMDPKELDMPMASQTGADRIELYTESYAENYNTENSDEILKQYQDTALAAQSFNLGVNAGHDLNLENLEQFLMSVYDVKEVSIGHAIVIESIEYGFNEILAKYLDIIDRVNQQI